MSMIIKNNAIKTLLLLLSLFLTFNTAVVSAASGVAAINSLSDDLGLGNNEDEILEPDVAFKLTTDVKDANNVVANWQIADKHYLYRNKFKFKLLEGEGVQLGEAFYPLAKQKMMNSLAKFKYFIMALKPLFLSFERIQKRLR